MAGETGLLYLLKIETSPGVFTTIVCQENTSLTLEGDAIEVTGKCNSGIKAFIPGLTGWKFAADGAYVLADTATVFVEAAWSSRTIVGCQISRSDGTKWDADAVITKMQYDMPHDGKTTFSLELQGTGTLVKV